MRSNVALLVVLFVMLACFAVVRPHPLGVYQNPGNWVLALGLVAGAVAVALRRPASYVIGMTAAGLAVVGGLLSLRNLFYTALPGHPAVWVAVGLYLMVRLSVNLHEEKERREKARRLAERDREPPLGPGPPSPDPSIAAGENAAAGERTMVS
jgi:hypothetical protein